MQGTILDNKSTDDNTHALFSACLNGHCSIRRSLYKVNCNILTFKTQQTNCQWLEHAFQFYWSSNWSHIFSSEITWPVFQVPASLTVRTAHFLTSHPVRNIIFSLGYITLVVNMLEIESFSKQTNKIRCSDESSCMTSAPSISTIFCFQTNPVPRSFWSSNCIHQRLREETEEKTKSRYLFT